MFTPDNPIQEKEEDILNRRKFVQHLSNAILEQEKSESIVIALCGEWGSGKSSIINLAIKNIEVGHHEKKPIIIRFNPWVFSEKRSLTERFFNEIANNTDDEFAKLLREYGEILNDAPKIKFWFKFIHNVMEMCGVVPGDAPGKIAGIGRWAQFIQNAIKENVLETKERIKGYLNSNQKKMLIVIDDIDRLNQLEIKETFQIIKANADFPNTIYLLTFDRKVVEQNLSDELKEGSGKGYMNKIVQVDFDIPVVNKSKILSYFIEQLNQTLDKLPEKSAKKYFPENSPRWQEIYHSGFTNFFKNIRDVKRYINSLKFNLSQMHQNDVMAINPIDFIAIEAIRVFVPDFYLFMKNRKTLFASISQRAEEKDARALEVKEVVGKLPDEVKSSVQELIEILFPQVFSEYVQHSGHNYSEWKKDLRVCSENIFDDYFTMIPGGSEDELNQFEIEKILSSASSAENLEKILIEYEEKGKFEKMLERIGVFMDDKQIVPAENVKNIVQAFFNISDGWQNMSDNMIGSPIPVMLHRLLKREPDKNTNLKILKEVILSSKGLFGPVEQILCLISKEEKGDSIVPKDKIEELQKLCIKKIEEFGADKLLYHNSLGFFMYRWQDWGKKEGWKKFMSEVQKDEVKILIFIGNYAAKVFRYGGDGVSTERSFTPESYKALSKFFDVKELKIKLEEIKNLDPRLYEEYKETIDMYLDDFDQKNGIEHETSD